ncbi:GntR family transcriptional regulator [Streptomyces microflavus]|uniref:GntR family transcriptional regulator n=1 Tax=Streptomyces microflavus TaxID=1919 RepID=UPI003B21A9B7
MTATQIAAALRHRILSGEFAFGSRLPNVRDLAEHYDVSQQTAAAAYAALAGMGMVRTHRGKQGTVVAAGPPASAHLGTFAVRRHGRHAVEACVRGFRRDGDHPRTTDAGHGRHGRLGLRGG